MSAPLVFIDTETTGLSLNDDIWEFAAIVREDGREDREVHMFIEHDEDKCKRLPEPFREDHYDRYLSHRAVTQRGACNVIERLFFNLPKPHIVGAVPNFDAERILKLLGSTNAPWHHHLIDVEPLAIGWLAAQGQRVTAPWDSNWLTEQVEKMSGLDIAAPEAERHTAMGDARWAMRLYDTIMLPPSKGDGPFLAPLGAV